MKTWLTAFLAAGVLIATGCTTTTEQPSARPASLDEVHAALDRTLSTTGEMVERQVMGIGSQGTIEWTMTADFDGTTGNYRLVIEFSANPRELGRQLTGGSGLALEDLKTEVLRIDNMWFLTMGAWPPRLRGRWLPGTLEQTMTLLAARGVQIADNPRSPSRLLALIGSADPTVTRNGPTYRLTVRAPDAVSALGNSALRTVARRQVDSQKLTGTVPVEVTVDGEGRIDGMRMDATDLMRQILEMTDTQAPPGGVRTTIELRVKAFGKPVSVTAPPADKLIDPAEMGG